MMALLTVVEPALYIFITFIPLFLLIVDSDITRMFVP